VLVGAALEADLVRLQPVALVHEVAEQRFFLGFLRDEVGVAWVEDRAGAAALGGVFVVLVIEEGGVVIEQRVFVDEGFAARAVVTGQAADVVGLLRFRCRLFLGFFVLPVLAGVEDVQAGAAAHRAGGDGEQCVGDPE
jgi:hypothetical protein